MVLRRNVALHAKGAPHPLSTANRAALGRAERGPRLDQKAGAQGVPPAQDPKAGVAEGEQAGCGQADDASAADPSEKPCSARECGPKSMGGSSGKADLAVEAGGSSFREVQQVTAFESGAAVWSFGKALSDSDLAELRLEAEEFDEEKESAFSRRRATSAEIRLPSGVAARGRKRVDAAPAPGHAPWGGRPRQVRARGEGGTNKKTQNNNIGT